jgi:ABC-type amino acid transport system permease subunit
MELSPLWDWFRELHAATGIRLTIFYDAFDRARFINGFLTSVRLMALCTVASVTIEMMGAWVQRSRLTLLRAAMAAYVQFFRNTPPLVQEARAGQLTAQHLGIFWDARSFLCTSENLSTWRCGRRRLCGSAFRRLVEAKLFQ